MYGTEQYVGMELHYRRSRSNSILMLLLCTYYSLASYSLHTVDEAKKLEKLIHSQNSFQQSVHRKFTFLTPLFHRRGKSICRGIMPVRATERSFTLSLPSLPSVLSIPPHAYIFTLTSQYFSYLQSKFFTYHLLHCRGYTSERISYPRTV